MREIYYNSDITPKAVNEIKLLALYYDKINIVSDVFYSPKFEIANGEIISSETEAFPFVPQSFCDDHRLLIDEGIISITKRNEQTENPYGEKFSNKVRKIILDEDDYLFPLNPKIPNNKIITDEMYDMMTNILAFEWGKPLELNFVRAYYLYKMRWSINLLTEGSTCITSSKNLNHLFTTFIRESEQSNISMGMKGYSKSIAIDALKIGLPNPDTLSIEDILELKLKLKDELTIFYQTINAIEVKNKQLFDTNITQQEYESIFHSEVQKPLVELKTKMQNLKSKTFRHFVDKMKDYKTYVPLVGTVVASLPMQYAVMTSLGMTLGQSYLEFKEEQREIKNNGLYFLLKLNDKIH